MKIVGCDLHTRYQQIAMLDEETGELAGGAPLIAPIVHGIGNSAGTSLPIDGSLVTLNQTNASPTVSAPILEEINPSTGAQIASVNLTDSKEGFSPRRIGRAGHRLHIYRRA